MGARQRAERFQQAIAQGAAAYVIGLPSAACPYGKGDWGNGGAWHLGWDKAHQSGVRRSPEQKLLDQPVVIKLSAWALDQLSACEEGSYDDCLRDWEKGLEPSESNGRHLGAHIHKVACRYKSKLVIRTAEEAEDAFYAVCSGTFQLKGRRGWAAANKIADALRPFATPETVARWMRPYEKDFDYDL